MLLAIHIFVSVANCIYYHSTCEGPWCGWHIISVIGTPPPDWPLGQRHQYAIPIFLKFVSSVLHLFPRPVTFQNPQIFSFQYVSGMQISSFYVLTALDVLLTHENWFEKWSSRSPDFNMWPIFLHIGIVFNQFHFLTLLPVHFLSSSCMLRVDTWWKWWFSGLGCKRTQLCYYCWSCLKIAQINNKGPLFS